MSESLTTITAGERSLPSVTASMNFQLRRGFESLPTIPTFPRFLHGADVLASRFVVQLRWPLKASVQSLPVVNGDGLSSSVTVTGTLSLRCLCLAAFPVTLMFKTF